MPERWRARIPLLGLAALALASVSCVSSTQRIRVTCVPERVEIYVDGRLLEGGAEEILLRTDEPHKVFVKAPGFEPTLVVLEPHLDAEGRQRLGPDELCIEPVPVGMLRELELEIESKDDEGAAPPSDDRPR